MADTEPVVDAFAQAQRDYARASAELQIELWRKAETERQLAAALQRRDAVHVDLARIRRDKEQLMREAAEHRNEAAALEDADEPAKEPTALQDAVARWMKQK
jgi:hypothetical protein